MSVSFSTIVQRARPSATHITNAKFRETLSKLPLTTMSKLGNGVRVAAEENPNAKLATVGLWLESGIVNENIAHLGTGKVLERCGFLGTTNQDRAGIAKAIEEIGGQIEVDFGREHSYLMVKCQKEHTTKAVSLLADLVRNARLTDSDIATAKQMVNDARHEFEERVDEVCDDNLWKCAYDSTPQSIGHPLYGAKKTVNSIDRSVLEDFRKVNICGKRVVVVGAGAVNHTDLEKAAEQFLGDLNQGHVAPAVDHRFVGGDIKLWNVRMKTTHIMWGFETCGASCEDSLPLQLAVDMNSNFHRSQHELGQTAIHRALKVYSSMDHGTPTTTPLPKEAIETCNSFLKQYSTTGLCGQTLIGRPTPTGPGDAGSMQQLQQVAMSEWCRMSQKLIHDTELEQGKTNLKSQLLYNMDGSANCAKDIATQVLYHGRRVPIQEMYDRIDDITGNNVQEVLQHYLYGRRPVYSYMGYNAYTAGYDWSAMWTWRMWN